MIIIKFYFKKNESFNQKNFNRYRYDTIVLKRYHKLKTFLTS